MQVLETAQSSRGREPKCASGCSQPRARRTRPTKSCSAVRMAPTNCFDACDGACSARGWPLGAPRAAAVPSTAACQTGGHEDNGGVGGALRPVRRRIAVAYVEARRLRARAVLRVGVVRGHARPQLLFAGDSTIWQLFLSFVLLHGGQLGRNAGHISTASSSPPRCVATACAPSSCGPTCCSGRRTTGVRWRGGRTRRSRRRLRAALLDADLVVFGIGHHLPRVMDRLNKLAHPRTGQARRLLRAQPQPHAVARFMRAARRDPPRSSSSARRSPSRAARAGEPISSPRRWVPPPRPRRATSTRRVGRRCPCTTRWLTARAERGARFVDVAAVAQSPTRRWRASSRTRARWTRTASLLPAAP